MSREKGSEQKCEERYRKRQAALSKKTGLEIRRYKLDPETALDLYGSKKRIIVEIIEVGEEPKGRVGFQQRGPHE